MAMNVDAAWAAEHARSAFDEDGFLPAFPVLDGERCAEVIEEFDRLSARYAVLGPPSKSSYTLDRYWKDILVREPWFKSLFALSTTIRDVACMAQILNRVEALIGPDILLWGAQNVTKAPGERHLWHVDAESRAWPTVNVWLGLKNVSSDACLRIVTRSQNFVETPTSVAARQSVHREDDDAMLACATSIDPLAQLIDVPCAIGEAIAFQGAAWHGSRNDSVLHRTALLLQYSPPSADIRIPTSFSEPATWHPLAPPTLLVRGPGPAIESDLAYARTGNRPRSAIRPDKRKVGAAAVARLTFSLAFGAWITGILG